MTHSIGAVWHKSVNMTSLTLGIAGIVLGIYLSINLKNVGISNSLIPTYKIQKPGSQLNAANPNAGNKGAYSSAGFTYNFSNIPNGPLPAKDWNFEVGNKAANYNHEAQTYTRRSNNVRVENGALILEARRENSNGKQYTSARINTLHKFAFTYGTLEVTMKLPSGGGTWPAAWLLPSQNIYDPKKLGISSTDPYKWALNGEIDFEEAIGGIPNENLPAAHSYNEFHRPPTLTPVKIPDAYGGYHRYGIIKTPDKITFTLDGVPFATRVKNSNDPLEWPYNQPYYLVLNLAMGGNWVGVGAIDPATNSWVLSVQKIEYRPL
jgi:beta-glucanase (GH16 family)